MMQTLHIRVLERLFLIRLIAKRCINFNFFVFQSGRKAREPPPLVRVTYCHILSLLLTFYFISNKFQEEMLPRAVVLQDIVQPNLKKRNTRSSPAVCFSYNNFIM